jgi:TPR repeat protein
LRLGEMFEQGELFRRDLDQAASFYDQACKASTEEGCTNLARLRAERSESTPSTPSTPPSPTKTPSKPH